MPLINGSRHATVKWAGKYLGVNSMVAEISHGITPGHIILNILPQPDPVPLFGDLEFEAGDGPVILRDCKVAKWRRIQSNGWTDQLIILDRRWKWMDLGEIAAAYNQLDPHGKLTPWTIKSPTEIVNDCLDAMGEDNYVVDMPYGLTRKQGQDFASLNPPWLGIRHRTGTNCPVSWEQGSIPPAVALSSYAYSYGRHVIYQWKFDRAAVAIPGIGVELPTGELSIAHYSPEVTDPVIPVGIAVVGSPSRIQMRLRLVAVGEEWDGSLRPIDQLSYAPRSQALKQIIRITFNSVKAGDVYSVHIGEADNDPLGESTFTYTATGDNNAGEVANALVAKISGSADHRVANVVIAESDSQFTITLTSFTAGKAWSYAARLENEGPGRGRGVNIGIVQAAKQAGVDWSTCVPPSFDGVVATDQLTYEDARLLARRSIYLIYQLDDVSVSDPNKPIHVPGFGNLDRRQQLVLLQTKIEQVKPTARDLRLRNGAGQPMTVNLYNGYSRDLPAIVYGVAAEECFRSWFHFVDGSNLDQWRRNTQPGSPLYMPLSIDPIEQTVRFPHYVYKLGAVGRYPADLVLETSVHVRDNDTSAMICYEARRDLPGGRPDTNYQTRRYPDIQREVIGIYNNANVLTGFKNPDDDDTDDRAKHYLDGMQIQFRRNKAETIEYNGILPLELDGAIQQVTWRIDGSGCSTTASRNTEHSIFVRKFRDRIRDEFLDPVPFDPRLNGPLNDADLFRGPPRRS